MTVSKPPKLFTTVFGRQMSSKIYTSPVPRMPPGLIELMEGLAKDVLKNNPSDIFHFCSQHMGKLLKIRDGDAPKNGLSLSQKIIRAQKIVRHRSEMRQKLYDNSLKSFKVEENTIHSKREAVGPESDLISSQELVHTKDNLDVSAELTNDINVDDKKATEIKKLEYESSDTSHTTQSMTAIEILELNSKTVLDQLQNCDNDNNIFKSTTEYNVQNVSKDQDEIIDCKDLTVSIMAKNVADVLTNTIIDNNNGDEINKTTEDLVKDDINSNSRNEEFDIKLKLSEIIIENFTNTPVLLVTPILEEKNDDQNSEDLFSTEKVSPKKENDQISKSVKSEDSPLTSTPAITCNNNISIMMEPLNFDNISEEKYTDIEIQNNFTHDMDLEKAAITIQKVFRSFLFKSKTCSVDDATNIDINLLMDDSKNENHECFENAIVGKEKRPIGLSRMDTVLQTVNEEKSLSLSTDDSSTLSSAATIIQAHVRGFLVRNKLNFNKTISTTSNIDSDIQSPKSTEKDINIDKNKMILNIHIVPEGGNYLSRDESMMTSIDLPLDGSPPQSSNLHPLGYDKNERRKQLKREDAIQSISPPSNNSGKSEDVESVKEVLLHQGVSIDAPNIQHPETDMINSNHQEIVSNDSTIEININDSDITPLGTPNQNVKLNLSTENSTDEMDVITPFANVEENGSMDLKESKLLHSGEFHDIVLPTMVSRSNTSVVRGE